MANEPEAPPTCEAETVRATKDLRSELTANLKSEFATNIWKAGTLPKLACDTLLALLDKADPTTSEVIAALELEDRSELSVSNE
jgi:hypothetical protein